VAEKIAGMGWSRGMKKRWGKGFFRPLSGPQNFNHMLDFLEVRVSGHDGSFMFPCGGEGKAICEGDGEMGFIFGCLEN
jgi:hypothetical protein